MLAVLVTIGFVEEDSDEGAQAGVTGIAALGSIISTSSTFAGSLACRRELADDVCDGGFW
jgi:hypothetical protein